MKLSELLNRLLEGTPLTVLLREDFDLPQPEALTQPEVHAAIGDAVAEAAKANGLSVRGAYAFGEWLAELCSGWSTRFANESDIMLLDEAFGQAAYNNPKEVIRLYLLPTWEALGDHLPEVQRGVAAAFEAAR
ncbi:hypothetical protein Q2T83_03835 [Fervidibacter sacchari]|uniref:Uncharacterized protein n=1 Tax=Candidatus Fervidibacter sacchari TaxID=1448929 RepID=A0ABT2EPE1_9BACT|nr:hypothetical protein [Candidatus Fervidibacter sacchari]MCS3919802.1 hypothetical protein [Candidatus Fervidibacter sacchari]WKU16957.1 hypothetical protein Q2T83_03835 [Candidatus Fervidibacter sacchari]